MSASYETAKRVALGMEKEAAALPGDDLWNISLDGGFGIAAEMPFQFFEKGFDPPDEQEAQKSTLMLHYEAEYAADRRQAEENLAALLKALAAKDAREAERLLAAAPPAQWLSLIFLDGETVKRELVPRLKETSDGCRAAVGKALDEALEQLVEFKALLQALKSCC